MKNTITRFTGKIYPDRSFALGAVPRGKKGQSERTYDLDHCNQPETNYGAVADWLEGKTNTGGQFCSISENPNSIEHVYQLRDGSEAQVEVLQEVEKVKDSDFSNFYDCEVNLDLPLLVKSPKSSQKKRGRYGKHGITGFGKRVVKNACILLQQRYGRRRLGFATATLPDLGISSLKVINANLSNVVRRFYQKIGRIYKKRGSEFIYVGVTEIQEKRFKDSGIPVPHLHFVYVSKTSSFGGYVITTKDAYSAWNDAVNEVLQLHDEVPLMGRNGHIGSVKLESVRSSAAAYIGKYVTKGCAVVKAMQEAGFNEFPRQWWTASMQMKKMFKSSIIHLSTHTCKSLFYGLETWMHQGKIEWCNFVDVWIGDKEIRVGLVGVLSKEAYFKFLKEKKDEI